MRYLLLIYGDEKRNANLSESEMAALMGEWFAYTEELQNSGKMLGGEALQPTATATMVRVDRQSTVTTDGPYMETKEQLGGFYMIDADNLDEAVGLASRMPHMKAGGGVEVRPVMEFDR